MSTIWKYTVCQFSSWEVMKKSEDNNAMCEENMQTIGNQCEALKNSSWGPGGLCAMDCLPLHICPPLPPPIEFPNLDIDTFIMLLPITMLYKHNINQNWTEVT